MPCHAMYVLMLSLRTAVFFALLCAYDYDLSGRTLDVTLDG